MGKTNKIFDGLLVLQYQSGNRKTFSLLVKGHQQPLCRHAYWYTHDIEISKDIVQDSWGVILSKIENLRDPNCFGSWAMRIVTRKSLDYLKKTKTDREKLKFSQKESDANEDTSEVDPNIKKLSNAMRLLPNNQRVVLRLFYTEDYSLKEISDTLKISKGTVKSRLYHAREKLKTILKK